MSELKAGVIKTPHDEGMSFNRDSDHVAVTEGETEFYLKSEADKVIRRQKFKRCLNMAKWCFTKSNYHYIVGREEGGRYRTQARIQEPTHPHRHGSPRMGCGAWETILCNHFWR